MLTEKIYCPCGRVVRIKQHETGQAMLADRDARMNLPVEYCSNCRCSAIYSGKPCGGVIVETDDWPRCEKCGMT